MTKSYENKEFIGSKDARILRILSEFIEPQSRLSSHNIENTIVFFGSARILPKDIAKKKLELAQQKNSIEDIALAKKRLEASVYYEVAYELAKKLALWSKETQNNKFFICTGGGPGIMEAANKGASSIGCKTIGFNITLPFEQQANPYVTKELIFDFNYFFMRKFWFINLAKAIIVFPGGFGTLDELFEILTLIQTNKVKKNIPIVLYGSDFFNNLINFKDLEEYKLINKSDLNSFFLTNDITEAFNFITTNLSSRY